MGLRDLIPRSSAPAWLELRSAVCKEHVGNPRAALRSRRSWQRRLQPWRWGWHPQARPGPGGGASPVPPPPGGRLTLAPGSCAEAPACPGHVAVSRNRAFTGKASPSRPAPAQPAPRAAVMPRGGQHPGMTLPARRGTTCPHGGRSSPAHTVLADASLRDCERMTLALKPLGLCSGDSAWGTRI